MLYNQVYRINNQSIAYYFFPIQFFLFQFLIPSIPLLIATHEVLPYYAYVNVTLPISRTPVSSYKEKYNVY